MKKSIFVLLFLWTHVVFSQADSTRKLDFLGYLDTYYAFDASNPSDQNRAYFVSSTRHNELNINIAAVGVSYQTARFRSKILVGFGTYMNSNYAAEAQSLKNILEAYAGIKLSKTKDIWLDAGVMSSPFSSENCFSVQQTMYSRSFAPEYVPYYLSAARLSVPLGKKFTWYAWLTNGWQQIQDVNTQKSFISQLEFRPTEKILLNWNFYVGDERSQAAPNFRTRYFFDVYAYYKGEKFSANTCFYVGNQKNLLGNDEENRVWWQANLQGKYQLNTDWSLSGRIEYFKDDKSVQIAPINNVEGFEAGSFSLGLNYTITENLFLRFEGRSFFSPKNVFKTSEGNPSSSNQLIISSLAASF